MSKSVLENIKCSGKIWSNYNYVPCQRKAGESGYCGTHDPQKIKARADKKSAKWEQEYEAHKQNLIRTHKVEMVNEEIIAFVRALSEDPRTLPWFETARQLIAKLDRDAAIEKANQDRSDV